MKPDSALSHFKKRLGRDESQLVPRAGIDEMIRFFRDERAEGCLLENDQDMLLYQWGVYDWGKGESFELDITRQLISTDAADDDDIWQLSLTFRYSPSAELRAVPPGNRWCENLSAVDEFAGFIAQSRAFQAFAELTPNAVELRYECAG